jgi:hypothetical protein
MRGMSSGLGRFALLTALMVNESTNHLGGGYSRERVNKPDRKTVLNKRQKKARAKAKLAKASRKINRFK